jgi:hypothetical protein
MTLFAHRFLTHSEPPAGDPLAPASAGRYDEHRGLQIDVDGKPVVSGHAGARATETRGDSDPPDALTQLETKGDPDPDRYGTIEILGRIKTAADPDEDRAGWH